MNTTTEDTTHMLPATGTPDVSVPLKAFADLNKIHLEDPGLGDQDAFDKFMDPDNRDKFTPSDPLKVYDPFDMTHKNVGRFARPDVMLPKPEATAAEQEIGEAVAASAVKVEHV